MSDLINRQDAIDAMHVLTDSICEGMAIDVLSELPSAEPTLYGYNIEYLAMIAKVMEQDSVSPQKVIEILSDVGRVAEMIYDEQTKLIRKEVERWI